MKNVLLSHDDKVCMYTVPDEVADHLQQYCMEFAVDWIWNDPAGAKLLRQIRGQTVAVYGTPDFIDYLNTYRFPDQPSRLAAQLDYYDYELPEAYRGYPQFNF